MKHCVHTTSPPRLIGRAAPLACALLIGGTGLAHADSIASGIATELGTSPANLGFQGDSRFGVVDDGGDGTLDVGDRINGQFVVRNIGRNGSNLQLGGLDNPGSNVNELTGFVELEVLNKTGNAQDGYTYEFGAFTSNGNITSEAGNSDAIIALYEDAEQNGMLSGLPIPDPTLVNGQAFAYLGLNAPGARSFTVQSVAGANGLHSDAASGGAIDQSVLVSTGDVSLNLIDQGGSAITDQSRGEYGFGTNQLGTQFAGDFDFFGGAGTGADFTGTFDLTSNVTIIPLPPAALAALPGLVMAFCYTRRRRGVA